MKKLLRNEKVIVNIIVTSFVIFVFGLMLVSCDKKPKEIVFSHWEIVEEVQPDSVNYFSTFNGNTIQTHCTYYYDTVWVIGKPNMNLSYAYNTRKNYYSYVTSDSTKKVRSLLTNYK